MRESHGRGKELAAALGIVPNALSMWLHDKGKNSNLDKNAAAAVRKLKAAKRQEASA